MFILALTNAGCFGRVETQNDMIDLSIKAWRARYVARTNATIVRKRDVLIKHEKERLSPTGELKQFSHLGRDLFLFRIIHL